MDNIIERHTDGTIRFKAFTGLKTNISFLCASQAPDGKVTFACRTFSVEKEVENVIFTVDRRSRCIFFTKKKFELHLRNVPYDEKKATLRAKGMAK